MILAEWIRVMVCVKEKLCDLQEAHLNSQMLPGWENMERLLGTESHRLFLDFPSSRRQSVWGVEKSRDPINDLK